MILGTSAMFNGTDCYILAVRSNTIQFYLQYFRMSDGVLLQQSPDTGIMTWYDSILADETQESNILLQGFAGAWEELSFLLDILSWGYTKLVYAENGLDIGLYTYRDDPFVFSVDRHLNSVFYYDYITYGNAAIIMELNYSHGVDVWGNKGQYYILTPNIMYRCPTVIHSVCSEFIKISVNLTAQYNKQVVRGITFDKKMQKMYFIGDPQTLYTVDVATQTIESQISLSQLFDEYPQIRNLRLYEE